jgi:hypothetical protein
MTDSNDDPSFTSTMPIFQGDIVFFLWLSNLKRKRGKGRLLKRKVIHFFFSNYQNGIVFSV